MKLKNSYLCFYCAKEGKVVSFPSPDEAKKHLKEEHNVNEIKLVPTKLIINRDHYAA